MRNNWQIDIEDPIQGRLNKPRDIGKTMVLDKGLALAELNNLIDIAGEYIDIIKFSFGTSFVTPNKILKEKIEFLTEKGIDVYPGGTLFEVALSQDKINEFLFRAKQIKFSAIEISNGTLEFGNKVRTDVIKKCKSLGFKVITEVGKKDQKQALSLSEMLYQIKEDRNNGADKIIIEGRESGKGISIYKEDGSFDMKMFEGILLGIPDHKNILIWEAPLKKQQAFLINKIGPNVNLGNIKADEVIALETLRRGLRGDTFKYTLTENRDKENMVGA